jgi:hypothetical protein
MSLDFAAALPEPTLNNLSANLLAELTPHLVFARPEPTHRLISSTHVISGSIRVSRAFLDPGGDLPP